MDEDLLGDFLRIMLYNHSNKERLYDLLCRPDLWPVLVKFSRSRFLIDQFVLANTLIKFLRYCYSPAQQLDTQMCTFGGLDYHAFKEFHKYMLNHPPAEIFPRRSRMRTRLAELNGY